MTWPPISWLGDQPGWIRRTGVYGAAQYAVARHVLGNDDDAQDCVHDALLRIWQRGLSYRAERGSLRA